MQSAIEQALRCEIDVPVGCVIKKDGQIIAAAHNRRELDKDVTAHAEMLAIRDAQKKLNTSRLTGCEMYVTLEPCPMCAGAAINARIPRVVFGAFDPKAGSLGSLIDLSKVPYNHTLQLTGGILSDECAGLLRAFFAGLRRKSRVDP